MSLNAIHNVQLLAPNALSPPFSFSIGHGTAWFFGSICSCVKFHSDGRISLRLNVARVRRVTSSPG